MLAYKSRNVSTFFGSMPLTSYAPHESLMRRQYRSQSTRVFGFICFHSGEACQASISFATVLDFTGAVGACMSRAYSVQNSGCRGSSGSLMAFSARGVPLYFIRYRYGRPTLFRTWTT